MMKISRIRTVAICFLYSTDEKPCSKQNTINNIKLCSLFLASIFLFLSMFLLSGCKKENTTSYKVVDSGKLTSSSIERILWLDNERVLFPTSNSSTIWNLTTGQFTSLHLGDVICAQNGLVFFWKLDRQGGKYVTDYIPYYGALENPKEYPAPGPDMYLDARFNCDWASNFSRKKVPYRIKLKEDNYLEIVRGEILTQELKIRHGEARYYERIDLPPKTLPVYVDTKIPHNIVSGKTKIAEPYIIDFNQLRNAYFISPSVYLPGDPYYNSMWWLSRDGRLTQVPFPQKVPWPSIGRLHIYPLRDFYLALYKGGMASWTDSGPRGLYIINGDSVKKVLKGEISWVSVSPDGCRAAFSYARNNIESLSRTTIKLINFCERRK